MATRYPEIPVNLKDWEIDIARKIADELGVDIEFTPVTAQTRADVLLDNGQVDLVIATFTITEERKLLYNFTTPYYTDACWLLGQ